MSDSEETVTETTPANTTVVTESGDFSVYEAKIAELTQSVAAKDAEVTSLTSQLSEAKAANYDLLKQIPVTNGSAEETIVETTTVTPDIDDLFE